MPIPPPRINTTGFSQWCAMLQLIFSCIDAPLHAHLGLFLTVMHTITLQLDFVAMGDAAAQHPPPLSATGQADDSAGMCDASVDGIAVYVAGSAACITCIAVYIAGIAAYVAGIAKCMCDTACDTCDTAWQIHNQQSPFCYAQHPLSHDNTCNTP